MSRYPITPVPKPRMTRSDKWKTRPIVMRYREFKDQVRKHNVVLPCSGAHIIFFIPMPSSWSKVKKLAFVGQHHEQIPDLDNLLKALFDAVYQQDEIIYNIQASKFWSTIGEIIIK